MADFDLTQTDAQVQSILNDAQDAQGAGAQTTLTTDYIMLKGTNGRYHKILKDSFTEAVRNVLAGLLVNNDKGTTISQIAAIASGDFGSVTPANLASVLGGFGTETVFRGELSAGESLNINNFSMSIIAIKGASAGNALLYAFDAWASTKIHGTNDTLATLTNTGNGTWTLTAGNYSIRYCFVKMATY